MKISLLVSLPLLSLLFAAPALDAQFITLKGTASALTNSNTASSRYGYDSVNGYSGSAETGGYLGTPSTTVPGQYSFTDNCGMYDGTNPITQMNYGAVTTTSVSIPSGTIKLLSTGKAESGGNTLGEFDDSVTFHNPSADPVVINVTYALIGSLSRIADTYGSSRSQYDASFSFFRSTGPYSNDPAVYGFLGNASARDNSNGFSQTNDFADTMKSPVEVNFPTDSVGGSVVGHITLLPGDSTFNVTEKLSINTNESATADFTRGASMRFDLPAGVTYTSASGLLLTAHPDFFAGEVALSNGIYYLAFPNKQIFGYYSYLSDAHTIFHQDLGFEYVFETSDGTGGIYFYDFATGDFFYTSPTFSFPYLYDFNLKAFLYYYPDPKNPQRYNTGGKRYFYNFATGQIISK